MRIQERTVNAMTADSISQEPKRRRGELRSSLRATRYVFIAPWCYPATIAWGWAVFICSFFRGWLIDRFLWLTMLQVRRNLLIGLGVNGLAFGGRGVSLVMRVCFLADAWPIHVHMWQCIVTCCFGCGGMQETWASHKWMEDFILIPTLIPNYNWDFYVCNIRISNAIPTGRVSVSFYQVFVKGYLVGPY